MAGFVAEQFRVADIFSDHYSFTIPDYQRPYSWAQENADALFNDLLEFMRSFPLDDGEEQPFYFLGSILLIKEEHKPLSDIVDGQQRLTTLTILLAAIRALIEDDEETVESITDLLETKKNKLKKIECGYRLALRKRDEEFFKTYIQKQGGLNELIELKTQLEESQASIQANAKRLTELLQAELPSDKEKGEFAEFIIDRCCMVVISAEDIDSAYRIFSVLNNRGVPLSVADIMKSRIIGELPDKDKNTHTTKWEEMESLIGKAHFPNFFGYLRMVIKKTKPKEKLLTELSVHFDSYLKDKNKKGAISYLDNFLYPAYHAYKSILKNDFNSTQNKKVIDSHLFWLNKLSFNDWVPPVIRFLASKDKQNDVQKFVHAMERLAYSMLVSKANVNKRIERFSKITDALDKNEDIFGESSPLQLTSNEIADFCSGLAKPVYEFLGAKNCKILLLRLDGLLYNGNAGYHEETDKVTIEHVLPQTPKPKSQWLVWFKRPKEREQLVNCLGNLVLLDKGKNSEASNADFEEKKKKYFMSKTGVSPFALTTQVLTHKEWTADVIKNRKANLIDCLITHWELKN